MFGVVVCSQKGNATTAAAAGTSAAGVHALPGGFTILSEKTLALGQKVRSIFLTVFYKRMHQLLILPKHTCSSSYLSFGIKAHPRSVLNCF